MNSVDRVKDLCKSNRIPISKLEKDLGFANGYIGQLKKGTLPTDRAERIADYFNVPIDYLIHGQNGQPDILVEAVDLFRRYKSTSPEVQYIINALLDDKKIKWNSQIQPEEGDSNDT